MNLDIEEFLEHAENGRTEDILRRLNEDPAMANCAIEVRIMKDACNLHQSPTETIRL
jgi:hypothetical protein